MRRLVVAIFAVLAACEISASRLAAPQADGDASLPPFARLRSLPGMPSFEDGQVIASWLHGLQRRSPTFRDALAAIAVRRDLRVLLAPSERLRDVRFMGKTTFRYSSGVFTAWMDIFVARTRPDVSLEAIGHEFGHVAEVACLGSFDSIEGLQAALRQRAGPGALQGKALLVETPFPRAIGKAVVSEWRQGDVQDSRFRELAIRFGLTGCGVQPMADSAAR
jgi:hypothetical protein